MTILPNDMFSAMSEASKKSLNSNVAEVSPALYAAGARTNLTREERNLIETWSSIKGTHEKLMRMSNKDAVDNFGKLSPDMRETLKSYYNIDYGAKVDTNLWFDNPTARKLIGMDEGVSPWDIVKSPFRLLFAGIEQYVKAINTPFTAAQKTLVNRESFWTRSNFEASFDGDFNYEEAIVNPLIEKYGKEVSFAAMHLLAGKTPAQIIDAWGPNDGAILEAINKVFNEPDEIALIMDDFDRARLSPGRNVARWVNKTFDISAEEHPDWFRYGSGPIDAAFQIFTDPLTYLTLGTINIGKAAKLAKALTTSRDVVAHFNDPAVIRYFTAYGEKIGEYTKAKNAGNDIKAAEIKDSIIRRHGDHSTDAEIKLWSESGVVDFDTMRNQFVGDNPENFHYLIQGRVNGTAYAKEAAAFSTPAREFTMGAKEKVKEFFTGKVDWDSLDTVGAEKLLDDMQKAGLDRSGKFDFTEIDDLIRKTAITGLRKMAERQSSIHPGNRAIFFDDYRVAETLDTFRKQAYIAIGDKRLAHLVSEHFNTATAAQRINIKRTVDELTLRRAGIHGMPGGKEFIKTQLDFHYGTRGAMRAGDTTPKPASWNRGDEPQEVLGALHPYQFKDGIGSLDWHKISQFVGAAQVRAGNKLDPKSIAGSIGGFLNTKFIEETVSNWSLLTLVPQLGVRTAIDEGFFGFLTSDFKVLREVLPFGKGKKIGNVFTAATGDLASTGPVKNIIQIVAGRLTGRKFGAVRAITQKQRTDVARNEYINLSKGIHGSKREAQEAMESKILDIAIDKYGKIFTTVERKMLHDKLKYNPNILSQVSASNLVDALLGRKSLRGTTATIVAKSNMDLVKDELQMLSTGVHKQLDIRDITDANLHAFMFDNFISAFSSLGFKIRGKFSKKTDPAALFLKHNSLRTEDDLVKATNEFLEGIGFVNNGSIWTIPNSKLKDIKQFIESTTQMTKFDGLPDSEKVIRFIEDTFTDLYTRFHGTTGKFNEELYDVFDTYRKGFVRDHRMVVDDLQLAEATLHPAGLVKYKSYKDMIKDNLNEGTITTDLEFHYGQNLESWHRRYRGKMFEMMSRQSDDIWRQPILDSYYMIFRKESMPEELAYTKKLYREQVAQGRPSTPSTMSNAEDVAASFFTNRAMERAANQVLKYADNPEIRTVFAYNVRTVGRFYRAVEDFYRRFYRLTKDHKLKAIWRIRLMTQGLNANGAVHEDANGEQFIIMPMDDLIYSAVDGALQAITKGEASIKQPLFNDLTFKLTAGNPSFQTDAGIPYLSGPAGAVPVWAIKSLLGKFSPTANLAEDIDDMFLGSFGANVTFASAVTPKFAANVWKMLSPDERSQQEVSSYTQALSYNQANGLGINPEDDKYKDENGFVNEALLDSDTRKYLADTKIAAHNVQVTRILLGMVLPFAVQGKDTKDLPTYLKDNGVINMKASFYEVFDQIKLSYPDVSEPYELALATWMGENPGKTVYLVNTAQEGVKPLINYSKEMQNWAITNMSDIETYGAGALMFAPFTGEFDPAVYQWAEASGIVNKIPESQTADKYIAEYYQGIMLKEFANRYYAINDKEEGDLLGVSFADQPLRRASIAAYDLERKKLKMAIPGLENYIRGGDNTDAFDFVQSAYNYANSPNADIKPDLKIKVNEAYTIYNDFINYANQITMLDAGNGPELKRAAKIEAMDKIQSIIDYDPTKVIYQYSTYGLEKLMNAKSRDANVTLNRNVIK